MRVVGGGVEMSSQVESAFFEPDLDDRIRILIEYKESWKAIFWLMVSKDGSVYLGPRKKRILSLRKGSTQSVNGNISVNYSDGTEITNKELFKNAKISFHASGIINSTGERNFRGSLRNIQQQELLCTVLFQSLDRFDSIPMNKLKARDICLKFPIHEGYPLFMYVFVAPTPKVTLNYFESAKDQVNILLPYKELEGTPNLTVQLNLTTDAKGPWPPYTYILYPTGQQSNDLKA